MVVCPKCGELFHRWGHLQSFDVAGLRQRLEEYFEVRDVREVYYPNWRASNWEARLAALSKWLFHQVGINVSYKNIFFDVQKPS